MKKPLIKDMVAYFGDNNNWTEVWRSEEANLRIDRLKHTGITRLVHTDVEDVYIGIHHETITYSLDYKDVKGFDPYLGRWLRNQLNNKEIRTAIKTQWEENE